MSKLLLLGERPATKERSGPFTNKTGKIIRELMTNVRMSPDKAHFDYATSRPDVDAIVAEHQPEYIVLFGNAALQLYHPELRTGQCHGRAMLEGDIVLFPMFHQDAIARTSPLRKACIEEFDLLRHLARDRDHWRLYTPESCVKCRAPGTHRSREWVVYCDLHW